MAIPGESVEKPADRAAEAAAELEALYASLVRDHHRAIYRYVHRLLGDAFLAEDITQEAFLRAYRGLPRLPRDANHRAWLFRIASNAATDELRRRARRPSELFGLSPTLRASSVTEDARLGRVDIDSALQTVAPHHREVLLLFEFSELSAPEVAQVLGIRPAAARKRRQRAREALARILDTSR